MIPFSPPYIDDEVVAEVLDTLQSGWITSGRKVLQLEEEICKLTGCSSVVCVNSWTSAAIMMLKWYGVKEGDEVIIPAYTYSATALSVLACGATPIMVDILDDFTINPEQVRQVLSPRTKVIMPVDIAGWPANYSAINDLVNEKGVIALFNPQSESQEKLGRILVISDAAHSLGALYDNKSAAQKSDITLFSFHAVKNVTTAEGGCACINLPEQFNSAEVYRYLKLLSLNGQTKDAFTKSQGGGWKYDILFQGMKINMPDICASIGLAQMRKYSTLLARRKEIANAYNAGFCDAHFLPTILIDKSRESSYHLYPLRINNINEEQRDNIIEELTREGVSVNVHFIPMPMMTLFKTLGFRISDYPNSYKQYSCEISLPIYPQLTDVQIQFIISAVIKAVKKVLNNE